MQYAERLPALPTRRSIVVSVVALLVGAALAVGAYALIDDRDAIQASDKVVFVDTPAPGEGVRGIDDAAKAATIGNPPSATVPYLSHGNGVQDGAGTPERTFPHGPAAPHYHR